MKLQEGRISRVVFRYLLDQALHELGVVFLVLAGGFHYLGQSNSQSIFTTELFVQVNQLISRARK